MFLKTKKIFEKGKCSVFLIREEGFFSNQDYEVKIYTTKPRKKVPKEEEFKALSKLIAKANKEPSGQERYPLKVTLEEYKDINILLKKIDTVKDGE